MAKLKGHFIASFQTQMETVEWVFLSKKYNCTSDVVKLFAFRDISAQLLQARKMSKMPELSKYHVIHFGQITNI